VELRAGAGEEGRLAKGRSEVGAGEVVLSCQYQDCGIEVCEAIVGDSDEGIVGIQMEGWGCR
jgi:hypothetical protein